MTTRYFFNLLLLDDYVVDHEGVEAPNLEEAKRGACEILQEFAFDAQLEAETGLTVSSIEICDGGGRVLARVDTAEALAGLMFYRVPSFESKTWH
ncbi:hypothetical protein ABID21_001351 [Pseudorhizobium tarimense]|uniref:DUF6894 domain-containing protein n=1 Tax=Pseudorhizobium tarimense TaxID=1079109 RepID=A0ABV2H486_9HYPH|nr:hypothetical protein [Pseudorhizobium tarimense]MCJ8518338.1 hypothetical protein [Pseudorhizobium tarimense]